MSGRIRLNDSSSGRIRLNDNSAPSAFRRAFSKLLRSRRPADLKRVALSSFRLQGLPLKIRPAFVVLTGLTLVVLSVLGFHPTLAGRISPPVPFSDKLLHFVCFFLASALFFGIWSVDEGARRVWYWRWWAEGISGVVCAGVGSIGSEFVQGLLPYKSFQWGDVLANLLGTGLGIFLARSVSLSHRRSQELRRIYQPITLSAVDEDESDGDVGEAEEREMEEGRLGRRAEAQLGSSGRGKKVEENVWDAEDEDEIFGLGDDGDDEEEDRRRRERSPS